jgi:hypothetical protein
MAPVKEEVLECDEEIDIWFEEKIEEVKVEINTKVKKESEEEEDTDVITEI